MTPVESKQPGQASAANESQRVFREHVELLMDRLYGTALRLTRNPDEAEDVVGEAVASAWQRLDQLNDLSHLDGWLFRILHNTFISLRRRRYCREDKEVSFDQEMEDDDTRFSLFEHLHQPFLLWVGRPEKEFINRLLEADLRKAVDHLPDPFRIVVVMVEIQGYTYEEVAAILDLPLGTVRSRLNRARSLLQKSLWQQGRDAGLIGTNTGFRVGDRR
ncbi:RNA polymerase subunit sigma-24 [Marinobacter guineae]|uniref:RNA polymerase subunit sigma-24 n=1 Tax=Marinobacter guineae TaxID=432303 RepID=A0A2G1VCG7_9GAMM|nr:sigma-70 family RNA polymerase sigma factor [Marinobacter guineae]PHQ24382.1 RNA polymerase subunit sigma-24 [Marinobacter guineae]